MARTQTETVKTLPCGLSFLLFMAIEQADYSLRGKSRCEKTPQRPAFPSDAAQYETLLTALKQVNLRSLTRAPPFSVLG